MVVMWRACAWLKKFKNFGMSQYDIFSKSTVQNLIQTLI